MGRWGTGLINLRVIYYLLALQRPHTLPLVLWTCCSLYLDFFSLVLHFLAGFLLKCHFPLEEEFLDSPDQIRRSVM